MSSKVATSPLSDILEEAGKLTEGEITSLDKRYHTMSILQLQATDRLITTIRSLDEQNKRLEETNIKIQKVLLGLTVVGLYFATLSTLNALAHIPLVYNLLVSGSITLAFLTIISAWLLMK